MPPRTPVRLGFGLLIAGTLLVVPVLSSSWPLWVTFLSWPVGGLGMGILFNPTTLAAMSFAEPGREGTVSGQTHFADALGFSLMGGVGGADDRHRRPHLARPAHRDRPELLTRRRLRAHRARRQQRGAPLDVTPAPPTWHHRGHGATAWGEGRRSVRDDLGAAGRDDAGRSGCRGGEGRVAGPRRSDALPRHQQGRHDGHLRQQQPWQAQPGRRSEEGGRTRPRPSVDGRGRCRHPELPARSRRAPRPRLRRRSARSTPI